MMYREENVCLNPYNLTYSFYSTFYSYKGAVKLFYNDNFPNFVIFFRPHAIWPNSIGAELVLSRTYERVMRYFKKQKRGGAGNIMYHVELEYAGSNSNCLTIPTENANTNSITE